MKSENIEINGKNYIIRELTLEEGMPLLAPTSGNVDFAALIRLATTIDGHQAVQGEISMSVGMQLMPIVMRLNNFNSGVETGNV